MSNPVDTASAARGDAAIARFEARYADGSYLEKVPDWHASDAPWKAAEVHRMIETNALRPALVTDVGCGAGHILSELQKRMAEDTRFEGYDISPQAVRICRERENSRLQFFQADFLAESATNPDLLLLLDVFEHIPDYLGFLAALRSRADWFIFHIPIDVSVLGIGHQSAWLLNMRRKYGHLHYFTKDTALATLVDLGYRIEHTFYTDDYKSFDPSALTWKYRMRYRLRRWLTRWKPDVAAQVFEGFNLMVLARGESAGA